MRSIPTALVFASIRMTFHAILKIGDTFLQMFGANIGFVVFVAAVAGVGGEIARMAGDAGDRPAFAVIERESVLSIESRRPPGGCAVAGGAVCPKRAGVEGRVGMAVDARGSRPRELAVNVALFAVNLLMRARQREVGFIVIEANAIPGGRRVAGGTVRAKLARVFVILLVAGKAVRRCAFEDAVLMTLFAFNIGMFAFKFKG